MSSTSQESKNKLLVTLPQFEWAQTTVRRKAQQAVRGDFSKQLKSAFVSLDEKLTPPPEYVQQADRYLLNTNRNELRMLEKLAREEHAALVATVIPGYEERADKSPTNRAQYLAYRDVAVKRSEDLVALVNLIEKTLSR